MTFQICTEFARQSGLSAARDKTEIPPPNGKLKDVKKPMYSASSGGNKQPFHQLPRAQRCVGDTGLMS